MKNVMLLIEKKTKEDYERIFFEMSEGDSRRVSTTPFEIKRRF